MAYRPRRSDSAGKRSRVVDADFRLRRTLAEKLGPGYAKIADEIREGTHSLPKLLAYHRKLADIFHGEYKEKYESSGKGGVVPATFSDTASGAIDVIVSDFGASLREGKTFERAVRNLGRLTGEGDNLLTTLPETMRYGLRKALRGEEYVGPFPLLLTYLWDLKLLRPETYKKSLHTGKWVRLIASAAQAYLVKNPLKPGEAARGGAEPKRLDIKPEDIRPEEASIIAFVQDIGFLYPGVPLDGGPKIKFSPEQTEAVFRHTGLGADFLLKTGMPESDYLTWIVEYHNKPFNLMSGVAAIADKWEGTFFGKEEPLTPEQVFGILKNDLFTEEQRKAIDLASKYSYRCDLDELADNHFFIPFQMMRLLFGILEAQARRQH